MLYTPSEYCKQFLFRNKKVSPMTIKRRCKYGFLPAGHHARKLLGRTGGWVIEVPTDKGK
jgi:hypothetical protein